ncbi:MAG: DNA-3-methyladenine glycosylase 2 family protein [Deltaproteobacteria bacterium]|nr:DNA-3-methyladenine glycosylase 2 family protein [Deltaproteobacteria bacterium]
MKIPAVPRALTRTAIRQGALALAGEDPDLARLLDKLGEPPMWARRPGFTALVQIILEQQVSLAAARTMYRRLYARLGGVTPDAVCAVEAAGLREIGLTRQKAGYCFDLAAQVLDGTLDLPSLARLPDDEGRLALQAVRGLGPWSVDIYYVTALRRPDIWPRGDLALATALRDVKRLGHLPDNEEQQALARRWAPWRSVAARFMWAQYLSARGKYSSESDSGKRT